MTDIRNFHFVLVLQLFQVRTRRRHRQMADVGAHRLLVRAGLFQLGTRGRHGENRFLIGSVAERVVRTCPIPVLTVRQLTDEDPRRTTV